jgi:hypothetical protein
MISMLLVLPMLYLISCDKLFLIPLSEDIQNTVCTWVKVIVQLDDEEQ